VVTGAAVETRWRALNWPGWARRALTLAFFVGMNWLLLTPSDTFRKIHRFFAHEDKVAHAGIFLALAFLLRWSLPARGWRGALGRAALAALFVYAAGIETFQPLIGGKGRVFEWSDMASNFAGTFAGWLLFAWAAVAGDGGAADGQGGDGPEAAGSRTAAEASR